MQNKINNKWQWLRLIFLLLNILFPLRMAFAVGGIVTDGTVGPAQPLLPLPGKAEVTIPQSLGTTVGKNLFHSFEQFNVNKGQTVTFTENTPNALDNVVSRVTGGSSSNIDGTLRSTPGGHANLYLVNPAGVMFGQNARIDVPGAFHASTADEVRFQDGAKFSASQPVGSTLTAAAPASFGFLGTSSATNGLLKADLRVDGAQLAVKAGQKLDMVGRKISVENGATLSAPAGEVWLEAVGQGSMNVPVTQPSETAHGSIALTRSTIDASGEGGGKVIVRGSDLKMDQNALIAANTHGKQDGAGIDIRLTDDLNMKGGGRILAGTLGSGAAGNIHVKAKNLLIDGKTTINGQPLYLGTGISTETGDHTAAEKHSTGRAGDIELHIANRLSLTRGGQINSSSFSTGNAGNIMIKAGQLWIDRQNILASSDILGRSLRSGIFAAALKTWSGKGGNIGVAVQGDINMKGGGLIEASTFGNGAAGDIHVTAKNLLIDGQMPLNGHALTRIASISDSGEAPDGTIGNAGNIKLDIANQLSITGGGQVGATSFSKGNAGSVEINAGQLWIDTQGVLTDNSGNLLETGIFTAAIGTWSGMGGGITVTARGNIDINGGGLISAIADGNQPAGSIVVSSQRDINLKNGSEIIASTRGSSAAGDVTVSADQLSLEQNSFISTESVSGNGGNIIIKKSQLIQLINSGFKTSVSGQQGGGGGNISVNGEILVMETGLIQANTKAQGASGGRIDLKLSGLIPSGANLILGGDQPIEDWKPYEFGFNVIQAAAPNGISGHIQSTTPPQLDLSGVLSNLGMPQFDVHTISQDYCSLGAGSSLIRQGKGGLPPRSRDSVMY